MTKSAKYFISKHSWYVLKMMNHRILDDTEILCIDTTYIIRKASVKTAVGDVNHNRYVKRPRTQ